MHAVKQSENKISLGGNSPLVNASRKKLSELFEPIKDEFLKYDIPDDKMEPVIDHAMRKLIADIDMKPARIARKTAEYFKLKLKPKDNGSSEI